MNPPAETDPITRLAALNGPGNPLAILMAMLLSRRTQISESEVSALLGMNAKTVRLGLKRLAQMQVITRTQRYSGWMLTEGGRQLVLTSPMLLTTGQQMLTDGEREVNFTAPEGSQITAPALTTVVVVNSNSESFNPQTQLTTTTALNGGSGKSSGKNYRSTDLKDDPLYQPALRAALEIGEAVEVLWGAPLWPNVAQKIAENTVRRAWVPENKHLPILEDLVGWIAYVVKNANGIRTSAPGAVAANILGCRKPALCYRQHPGDYLPSEFLQAAGLAHLIPVREAPPAPLFDLESDADEYDEVEDDETEPTPSDPTLDEHFAPGSDGRPSRMTPRSAWQAAMGQMERETSKAVYDTWLRPAEPISYDPASGALVIGCPTIYAAEWLTSRLTSTVNRLLAGISNGAVMAVQFVTLDQGEQ